jgi:transcriptional regulator with GAF, ATPase, and Fis domain
MVNSTWLHSCAARSLPSFQKHVEILQSYGISLGLPARDASVHQGIVCFDRIAPALLQLIREYSHNGLHRLLAISFERSILKGDGIWQLLQAGASDVLAWDELPDPAATIIGRLERWQAIDRILDSPLVCADLVGRSRAWISTLRQVIEVACFTDAPILLLGETGTGKEQVARLIHALDRRPNKRDLVVLDCTTVVPELAGSEFFGHEKGAFTSAITSRDGAFALADQGTLFLDEVGELPPALQAQLLRITQEHTYKRVGSNTWRHTDFRLICATNRDLLREQTAGGFRHDLYYRIAGWVCTLPPLRERTDDIIPLTYHFMRQLQGGQEPPDIGWVVGEYLLARDYPGNVRDLKQLAARLLYRHVGSGPLTAGDIPEDERPVAAPAVFDWCDATFERALRRALNTGSGIRDIRRVTEDTAIRIAMYDAQGNLRRAAQQLGVTDRALQLRRAQRRNDAPDAEEFDAA